MSRHGGVFLSEDATARAYAEVAALLARPPLDGPPPSLLAHIAADPPSRAGRRRPWRPRPPS
jgi:hypothetical protein